MTETTPSETILVDRYFDPTTGGVADEVFAALDESGHTDAPGSPPLYSVLDPDALDSLFPPEITAAGPVDVRFDYEGATVVVSSDGYVRVSEPKAVDRDQRAFGLAQVVK